MYLMPKKRQTTFLAKLLNMSFNFNLFLISKYDELCHCHFGLLILR